MSATVDVLNVVDALSVHYFRTSRDTSLDEQLTRFLEICFRLRNKGPGLREAPGLCVVGESGAGKSAALHQALSKRAELPNYGVEGEMCPLISINAPASCSLLALGRELLKASGYPITGDPKLHVVWSMLLDRLPRAGVVAVHIDEFHNVVRTSNKIERTRLLKTLKSLLNDRRAPIGLIISGLPEIIGFLNSGKEDARRIRAVRFDPLYLPADAPMLSRMIAAFASKAGCLCEDAFAEAVVGRLVQAADRQLGIAIEIVREAIAIAVVRDQELCIEQFQQTYLDRTSCADAANPFVSDDWASIDVTRLLAETPTLIEVEEPSGRRSNRRDF